MKFSIFHPKNARQENYTPSQQSNQTSGDQADETLDALRIQMVVIAAPLGRTEIAPLTIADG